MERYNFLTIEKKWRESKVALSVSNPKANKKFSLFVSDWKNSFFVFFINLFITTYRDTRRDPRFLTKIVKKLSQEARRSLPAPKF